MNLYTSFVMIARSRKCLDTVLYVCHASRQIAAFSAIRPPPSNYSVPLPEQFTESKEPNLNRTNPQVQVYGRDGLLIGRSGNATHEPTHAKRRKRKPHVDDCIRILGDPKADNVSVGLLSVCVMHVETKTDRCDHPPSHLPSQQRRDECALAEQIWDKSIYMLYSRRQIVHILRVYAYLRDRNEVFVAFIVFFDAEPSASNSPLLPPLCRGDERRGDLDVDMEAVQQSVLVQREGVLRDARDIHSRTAAQRAASGGSGGVCFLQPLQRREQHGEHGGAGGSDGGRLLPRVHPADGGAAAGYPLRAAGGDGRPLGSAADRLAARTGDGARGFGAIDGAGDANGRGDAVASVSAVDDVGEEDVRAAARRSYGTEHSAEQAGVRRGDCERVCAAELRLRAAAVRRAGDEPRASATQHALRTDRRNGRFIVAA